MKRYDSYKDSGIEWIGKIPSHWKVTKLKFIGNIICGGTPSTTNEEYWTGNIPWIQSGKVQNNIVLLDVVDKKITENALVESSTKLVKKDSVLIAITGATCSNIGYLTFETAVNQSIVAVEPSNFNSVLLFNLLKSQKEQILFHQSGGAQGGVTKGDMMNIYIPYPTVEEQITIANYLDQKTTQIDDLIAKKENLIRLQEEERTAMINQAVTKGLDPTVPMKDSGIEWLGEIPANWEVKKLKYCFDIIGGYAFNSSDFQSMGIQLVKIGNLYQNQLQLDRQPTFLPLSFKEIYSNYLVKKNDILLSLTGTLGKRDYGYAILIDKDEELLINQRVAKITAKSNISIDFAINMFQSETYLNRLFSIPTGTKQGNLSGEDVLSIIMGIPSLAEQINIAKYITIEQNRINTIISKTQQEIELLKEYKTALISEVVTGKVDVRNEKLN